VFPYRGSPWPLLDAVQLVSVLLAEDLRRRATLSGMQPPGNISDFYPQWIVHGAWPCGHTARIDLGRFMAWGMHDVPMLALCTRLRCPACGSRGPAEIGTGWLGRDQESETEQSAAERAGKVRRLKPRGPQ
jgi:hypothetical protein